MTEGGTEREVPDSMRCDECGDILYADEEWRVKPERTPGLSATMANEYIHERCFPPETERSECGDDE